MMKKAAAILSITYVLSGCSSIKSVFHDPRLSVHFSAQPDTAQLYLNGDPYGTGPSKHATFRLTPEQQEQGSYVIEIPQARWPSGAVTPQSRKILSLDQPSHHITIRHPDPNSAAGRFDKLKNHSMKITYRTHPPTADIYIDGTAQDRSPHSRTQKITLQDYNNGYIELPAAEARWPSGTVAKEARSKITLENGLFSRTVELKHPDPDSPAGRFDGQKKHTLTIRFYTEPAMALLFSKNNNMGRAPASRTYTYSFADYERGSLILDPITARWTSGATTNSGPLNIPLKGATPEITLVRPEYPNLDIDLDAICREEEKARLEKQRAKSRALQEEHYREMERIETERLELQKKKLELYKRQQEAEEKERKELLRLKKLEVENNLKQQKQSSQ